MTRTPTPSHRFDYLPLISKPISPTPTPTLTPTTRPPTLTPTTRPPTLTPTQSPPSIYLTGIGDAVVDFNNTFLYAIVKIKGNASSHHFAVINYDAYGNYLDLLVNTTDPYEGTVLIDYLHNEHTTRFVVTATGSWEITLLPLYMARGLYVPGTIQGSGDDVIVLSGSTPDIAFITGNTCRHHFAVISYGDYGEYLDLLVNTTEPYTGYVLLDGNTKVLTTNAECGWSIQVTE